ncbi:MAG: tetratricopeptide repeat protein [Thermomicrobiaceae bacterium]
MAEVLLTQAVNQAEEAIESGNYGGAIETCQRILGQFPEFAGAHRIMAEAYAEQGDLESAREAFHRTLERDPQSIPAHLGLGMLTEDAGDRESALAYFQVAWEIDPRRRDLREQVSRISQQLYGADGRLYLTRAALASLHFHAGRWDRAVNESAQVLQEFPSRIDVQVRLAEALWRRGDDQQAKQVGASILRLLPSAVVPLLVLADIYRHEGDRGAAADYLKQARNIDPDGVRAADLIMVGFDDQADFLSVDSIPTIDDQIVHEEPARYARAPDFSAADTDEPAYVDHSAEPEDVVVPPEAPYSPPVEPQGVRPFSWDDIGDEDLEASDLDVPADDLAADATQPSTDFSLPTDEELERARPSGERPAGFTGMLNSLDSEGMQPFDPSGGGPEPSGAEQGSSGSAPEPDWMDMPLPTDEELEQSRPKTEELSSHSGVLDSLDLEGMEPFDPFGDEQPAQARPAYESSQAAEVAPESEPEVAPAEDFMEDMSLPSDEELERARPADERPAGFTGMLSSLDSEGMTPFDPEGATDLPPELPIESGDDPISGHGVSEPEPEVESEESGGAIDLSDMGEESPFQIDWSQIDGEIEEAIPGEMPRGYTDDLRGLDDFGLEPFSFEDLSAEAPEEPAGEEVVAGADELDLDRLTAGWDQESDDSSLPPSPDVEELDSVGVTFDEEQAREFSETELLSADRLNEPSAAESGLTAGEDWELDELLSSAEGVGDEWGASDIADPGMPETPETLLFDDTGHELSTGDEDVHEAVSSVGASGTSRVVGISVSPERLGLDESLVSRVRQMKQTLIEQGRIGGKVLLPGTGASIESLRRAVENEPAHIQHRIALASALVQEHPDDALEQFRWVYRNAPDHGVEIVKDLGRLIDVMREREVGVHRLLGALYRRHGDWLAAANHYEESLTSKRGSSAERIVRGRHG